MLTPTETDATASHHLLMSISLSLITVLILQSTKLIWLNDVLLTSFQLISLLAHLVSFILVILFLSHGRFKLARFLLIVSFISLLNTAIALWDSPIDVQLFFVLGMLVSWFIFSEKEKISLWITLCIFGVLFIYYQSIHRLLDTHLALDSIEPTFSTAFISEFSTIDSIGLSLPLINSVVFVFSFTLCGFWINRQLIRHNRRQRSIVDGHSTILKQLMPESLIDPLANRKKQHYLLFERHFSSVIFIDLSGFSQFSKLHNDQELTHFLHHILIHFDEVAEKFGVSKIKTNGDQYIAAINVEEGTMNAYQCAQLACRFALSVKLRFAELNAKASQNGMSIRIGVASGNIVFGVIGSLRPSFDIWGNTVNLSSRLESTANKDQIQVCSQTMLYSMQHYEFSGETKRELKGIGSVSTYILNGER